SLGTGSDTESLGTASDSESLDGGSLESIIATLAAGSSQLGSGDITIGGSTGSGETGSDTGSLLALGSLAVAGIGIGLVVSGQVQLPPLPEINLGIVCTLPPEAINFLKDNGSMKQEECQPEEQPAP
ncbi:hypothetical protein, partial [Dietzia sp. UBA5065]|uniref:hypothetical protein n=1 Tax=Dietzia sp. UBA5065 TaxID=1946422 RepID=UPI0025B91501